MRSLLALDRVTGVENDEDDTLVHAIAGVVSLLHDDSS
jgi:hypothetical protein